MTTREFLRKLLRDMALLPVLMAAVYALFAGVFWLVTTLTPPVTP